MFYTYVLWSNKDNQMYKEPRGLASRIGIFLIALALILVSAPHVYASQITKPANNLGLVGYWAFNEGTGILAEDSSGYRDYGSLVSGPAWSAGKIGNAIDFENDNAIITTPTASEDTLDMTGSFSMSFWLYVTSEPHGTGAAGNDAFLVSKQSSAVGDGGVVTFEVDLLAGDPFGGGTDRMYLWWSSGFNKVSGYASNVSYNIGQWDHWVIIRDNNAQTVTMYRNGVNVGTTDFNAGGFNLPVDSTNSGTTTPEAVQIGNNDHVCCAVVPFTGKIDELRIYNRVLSATEVANLYNLTAPSHVNTSTTNLDGSGLINGLVGHWTFDGADTRWTSTSVGTTTDTSGMGDDGGFSNMNRTSASVMGVLGQAVNFNKNGAVIKMPAVSEDNLDITGDLSVAFWMYYSTALNGGQEYDILTKSGGTGIVAQPDTFTIALLGGDPDGCTNTLDNINIWWSKGAQISTWCSDHIVEANQWVHWVIVRNTTSQAVTFYRNGVATGKIDVLGGGFHTPSYSTGSATTSPEIVRIGTNNSGGSSFKGTIDDLRIYNRVLSAAEVKNIYNLGSAHMNTSATTLTNGSTLTSGLKGHWTFDGADITNTIVDKSGSGNNGYFGGGATSSAKVIGKMGQALNFDGAATYVGVGPNIEQAGPLTVSAWIKPVNGAGGIQQIADDVANGGSQNYTFELGRTNHRLSTVWGNVTIGTSNTDIPDNKWSHVALTRSGSAGSWTWTLYLNGVSDGSGSTGTDPLNTGVNCGGLGVPQTWVGGLCNTTSDLGADLQFFNGAIDDVRIYNRPLSASEVKQLYLIGK